jgi:uncharacterized protein YcnI
MMSARLRALAVAGLAGGLVLAVAAPASAHVTLHSYEAVQGGSDALIQIRVPNEEDNATVTELEIDFPAATPLIGLYVQPTPGWTFQVTNSNLPKPITTDDGTITQYVSKVVWQGGSVPVGAYQDFDVDVSQLPMTPTLTVKALQSYSNGDIVRWIELPGPQGQVPDHPAPTLALAPPAAGPPTTAASPAAAPGPAAVDLSDLAKKSAVSTADALAIAGIILGGLGLVVGGLAVSILTRSRHRAT